MEKNKEVKGMGKKGIPHRKWSKEEKLKIVKEHMEGHESLTALGKKYQIRDSTWKDMNLSQRWERSIKSEIAP